MGDLVVRDYFAHFFMNKQNLIGSKYWSLAVIAKSDKVNKQTVWLCRCDCGTEINVFHGNLKRGNTKSCGCLRKKTVSARVTTHGLSHLHEYRIWRDLKNRCLNPENLNFKKYGGNGISVCQQWSDSFECFYQDMGPMPSPKHSVDSYPNKKGDYGPDNCRWATMKEQQGNRTNNVWIECGNIKMIRADWALYLGISYFRLRDLLKRNTIESVIKKCKETIDPDFVFPSS